MAREVCWLGVSCFELRGLYYSLARSFTEVWDETRRESLIKYTHGFQLTTVFLESFYLSASEPPGRSGKFRSIAMGYVSVVGFVKLMNVPHYSNRIRLSGLIHFVTHRKTKTGCSDCCEINDPSLLSY